jgi:NitT/TauT family transport system permease protein
MNRYLSLLVFLALFLFLWQLLPSLNLVNKRVIPPFLDVINSFPELFSNNNPYVPGGFYYHVYLTLFEVAVAYIIVISIALPLGFILGYYSLLRDAYEPLIYIFYSLPAPLLYPALYLLLGLNYPSKIALGVLLGIFPLLINIIAGFRTLEQIYFLVALSYGANGKQIFTKITLPGIVPSLMSGLRLSLSAVFIGVIVGQILASSDGGLGWIIVFTAENFVTTQMFATIIIVMLLVFFILQAYEIIERKLLYKYLKR